MDVDWGLAVSTKLLVASALASLGAQGALEKDPCPRGLPEIIDPVNGWAGSNNTGEMHFEVGLGNIVATCHVDEGGLLSNCSYILTCNFDYRGSCKEEFGRKVADRFFQNIRAKSPDARCQTFQVTFRHTTEPGEMPYGEPSPEQAITLYIEAQKSIPPPDEPAAQGEVPD